MRKLPIHYAQLGQHGLPTGGKKPSKRKAATKKKATAAIKKTIIIASSDLTEQSKRVPVYQRKLKHQIAPWSFAFPLPSLSKSEIPHTPVSTAATVSGVHAPYSTIGSLSSNVQVSGHAPPPTLIHHSPVSTSVHYSPTSSSLSPSPASTSSSVGQLFYVQLLTNPRISRCQGCRGAIEHGLRSSRNTAIQHKEHVLF